MTTDTRAPALAYRMTAVLGAVALCAMIFLGAGVAHAQVGYPPGTSTLPSCPPGDVNAGNVSVGNTITFTLCGNFTAGAAVSVAVDGVAAVTKTPVNGAVTVVVTVVSSTVVSIDDPVNAAVTCGTNTIKATSAGTPGASTGTFNLVCGTTSTTTGTGTTVTTVAGATTTTQASGGLAFTGANILRAVLIALGLIALGALLVFFQRRRRSA